MEVQESINIQAAITEIVPDATVDQVRENSGDLEVDAVGSMLITFAPGINVSGADDPAAAMESLCAHLQKQAPILPLCFKYTSVLTQSNVLENLSSTMTEPFYNLPNCIIHLDNT